MNKQVHPDTAPIAQAAHELTVLGTAIAFKILRSGFTPWIRNGSWRSLRLPSWTATGNHRKRELIMAKKSRGGRMTAAKIRAAKSPGGKGPIKSRPAGKKIMST